MTRASFSATIGLALALLCAPAASAAALPAAAWSINSLPVPTNFEPGGEGAYETRVTNIGAAAPDGGPLTITDVLPAGLTVESVELPLRSEGQLQDFGPTQCDVESAGDVQTVTCTVPSDLPESKPALLAPSEAMRMTIHVAVPAAASGTLTNFVQVEGGGAPAASASAENEASPDPAAAGFQEFGVALTGPDGQPVNQAGSHPYQYTTSFAVHMVPGSFAAPFVPAEGDLKDIDVKLPPGLIGNPLAISRCTLQEFNTIPESGGAHPVNECPESAAIGLVLVQQLEGVGGVVPAPLYNLAPPKGSPALLGFQVAGLPFYIDTSVRTGADYGVSAHLRNTSQLKRVTAASVTIWGVPADESHDPLRGSCLNNGQENKPLSLCSVSAGIDPKAFLRLPTSCASPLLTEMSFNTWLTPGAFITASSGAPAPEGCELLDFEPTLTTLPTTEVTDSPSGLRVELHIPQKEHEEPEDLGQADLKDVSVTFPPGLVINPASANGLGACASAQIDLNGSGAPQCPDASRIGTVEVNTPLVDHPLPGSVYVAAPYDNPFNSLLAVYVTVFDPATGVVVKLAGKVDPDPATGQLDQHLRSKPAGSLRRLQARLLRWPAGAVADPRRLRQPHHQLLDDAVVGACVGAAGPWGGELRSQQSPRRRRLPELGERAALRPSLRRRHARSDRRRLLSLRHSVAPRGRLPGTLRGDGLPAAGAARQARWDSLLLRARARRGRRQDGHSREGAAELPRCL